LTPIGLYNFKSTNTLTSTETPVRQIFSRIPKALLFGVIAAFGVAACTPAPSSKITPAERQAALAQCDGSVPCTVAILVADKMNSQKGRDFGGGVVLRGTKAQGNTLIVGADVPQLVTAQGTINGQSYRSYLNGKFVEGLCRGGGADIRRFFDLGGKVRLIAYLPSGEVYLDRTATSC
jgi:hypothetical protein